MIFEAQKRIMTYTIDKLFHNCFLLMCYIKMGEKRLFMGFSNIHILTVSIMHMINSLCLIFFWCMVTYREYYFFLTKETFYSLFLPGNVASSHNQPGKKGELLPGLYYNRVWRSSPKPGLLSVSCSRHFHQGNDPVCHKLILLISW